MPKLNDKEFSSSMKIKKIELPTPYSLYDVGTIMCNAYLIIDPCLTLIDTSAKSEKALEVLKHNFNKIGFSLKDLKRIIITHGHPDHYGLARELQKISNAEIYVHAIDAYKVTRDNQYDNSDMLQFLRQAGVTGDLISEMKELWKHDEQYFDPIHDFNKINGQLRFNFEDFSLKVIHTIGHTSGHICLYEEKDKILISGDHLLNRITPNPFIEFLKEEGARTKSLKLYLNTLKETKKLTVSKAFPAHGENISDHRKVIDNLFAHHLKRKEKIYKIIRESLSISIYEISEKLFPKSRLYNLMLGISEVVGHIDLLISEQRVKYKENNGVHLYSNI